MVIKVDEQGQEAVKQLCDIVLKATGLSSLPGINAILSAVHLEKPVTEQTTE
jgi:hypothetical protein